MHTSTDAGLRRVVVKVGSSTLTYPATGQLNLRRIGALATALADLKNSGISPVLVTSGAVASGMAKLGISERPADTRSRQAIAAVGQCALMHIYDKMLSEYGVNVGQILLTKDVIDNPGHRDHAANTFERLLELGVIPIVNENDSISTYELESLTTFGDNDRLSAYVALLCRADLVINLSDIDGLYDSDPRCCPDAKQISIVRAIDDRLRALAGDPGAQGTGGMRSKLMAAEILLQAGIDMVITNGQHPEYLAEICAGVPHGTLFTARNAQEG